ncbi:hypothetical protein BJ912DRAFT_1048851 [Pholiota molesta]|nr:hypothetical protein BJ912DRAFT_1048851 [Pholiota molesta]
MPRRTPCAAHGIQTQVHLPNAGIQATCACPVCGAELAEVVGTGLGQAPLPLWRTVGARAGVGEERCLIFGVDAWTMRGGRRPASSSHRATCENRESRPTYLPEASSLLLTSAPSSKSLGAQRDRGGWRAHRGAESQTTLDAHTPVSRPSRTRASLHGRLRVQMQKRGHLRPPSTDRSTPTTRPDPSRYHQHRQPTSTRPSVAWTTLCASDGASWIRSREWSGFWRVDGRWFTEDRGSEGVSHVELNRIACVRTTGVVFVQGMILLAVQTGKEEKLHSRAGGDGGAVEIVWCAGCNAGVYLWANRARERGLGKAEEVQGYGPRDGEGSLGSV